MEQKKSFISIAMATIVLFSLFAVVTSPTSVSGQASRTTVPLDASSVSGIMTGTSPGVSTVWQNGDTEIFAVATSGALWYRSLDNIEPYYGAWNSLGGSCTASPAADSWDSGTRMDVFVRGIDGALWHRYYQGGWYDNTGSWSGWEPLGGQLASGTGPAVSSWSAGRLDVFVAGTDNVMWHKWYNGAWSGWEPLGGTLTSSPGATSSASGTVDVFVRGTDGAVWQKQWTGVAWSGWKSLGGQLASGTGPGVGSTDIFVQGTDHRLWHKNVAASGGTGWVLSGMPPEALSATSPASAMIALGATTVCVASTSGNIWESASKNATWTNWESLGSPT
jgi:hypothetical protein